MQLLSTTVGRFFHGGGRGWGWGVWVKMSATMFGLRQKVKKKHWLKHPKALLQKMKFGPKHKRFEVSYFGILFLKILFRAYNFFISIHPFRWTTSGFFFNFRFLSIKSQTQWKLAKKVTHFTIQFCSKSFTHVMNPNLLGIENDMIPQYTQPTFQQICFC